MTDKQKRAVKLLNKLWNANGGIMTLSEDEYSLLMDFVVNEPQLTEGVLETLIDDLHKLSEKQGEQKHHEYTLEQAAGIFLDALSNTPYNNKPITDAQFITKELLKFLEDASSYNPNAINEQAPADKVEPKFHEGEWVVKGDTIAQILDIQEQYYVGLDINGKDFTSSRFLNDDKIHLWTIQDAKDGDVLACNDKVFLYNGKRDLRNRVCAYCGIYKTYDELRFIKCAIVNYFTYKEPYPATKEQRNLLFAKMREEGFEWDDEKKELKKIEQKLSNSENVGKNEKPKWSDEDDCYRDNLIRWLNCGAVRVDIRKNLIDWLKSLKQRMEEQR